VQTLRTILASLQAKSKDRTWLKNQTSGELDDNRQVVTKDVVYLLS
jgi:phosphoribosyl-AMP cyclohydrolase